MKTDYLQDVREKIEKVDNIRALISVEKKNQVITRFEASTNYNLLIGMRYVTNLNMIGEIFARKDQLILSSLGKIDTGDEEFVAYKARMVLKNGIMLKILYLNMEKFQKDLSKIDNYKIVVDKDRTIGKIDEKAATFTFPTKEDFNLRAKNFFFDLIELSTILKTENILRANYKYDKIKQELLYMSNLFIANKYSLGLMRSTHGEGLNIYLEKEDYEIYRKIFNTGDVKDFWDTIFLVAGLYRRLGLEVARRLDYEYPKLEDRESMKYIRNIFKEIEG